MGLPGDDEESKSNNSSNSSRSDSSDEPPAKSHTKPKPSPAVRKETKKRDKDFYKGIELAKKHCKNCISNLNYSIVDKSIEDLEQALEILRQFE